MKTQKFQWIIAVLTALICTQCNNKKTYTTTVNSYAADNLDLKAVTALATEVASAQELETKLNDPANKINNLDLNEDDQIDYIKVTEIDAEQKGFSLTVEVPSDKGIEEQEVATIQFDLNDSRSSVQTHGNPYIYGAGFYYFGRSRGMGLPIRNYFSRDHTPHRSQFGANSKPSNFSPSKPLAPKDYSSYHQSNGYKNGYGSSIKLNNTSSMASTLNSPNSSKVANNIKAPLKNPTTSQRKYQRSTPSKYTSRVRSSSSSRYGSSGSSRSRSSFGGGK